VIAYRPQIALVTLVLVFVVSGPIGKIAGLFRRKEPAA